MSFLNFRRGDQANCFVGFGVSRCQEQRGNGKQGEHSSRYPCGDLSSGNTAPKQELSKDEGHHETPRKDDIATAWFRSIGKALFFCP